ncbi:CDP-diacylglycerol--serine O-phosphatidyltransferase [Pseudoruegeria sp. SK021]|uniref:CDP-diacylglycerol--serine O-phosphatidyltransferase n=1 Tax=Pseudoruegeria sp. SK021 TaxID=1933035 RepID=UPI000A242319|nr:CDP-diacylglycerol--serine O-phosphatidyltransferase [Pseudoruegeria sp. SK021]OSP53670.1 CDP-diacylglycerol--serine O-phosphatidyltransferase [Pseudoruegeria sp. SK021]
MLDRPPERGERGEQGAVPILMLVPNVITLIGMSFGLTAIRFTIEGRFAMAVTLILMAVLSDFFDGMAARRLKAESPMGAQLDSLSDFLCFGVAPAIIVYQVHLTQMGEFGWIFALLFAAATCLRLARFNVTAEKGAGSIGQKMHFIGVPAPAGACLGLMPVFLTLSGVLTLGDAAVAAWLAFVGLLMISKLKTPSPRTFKVPRRLIPVILCATAIVIGLIFTRPWIFLVMINSVYLCMVLYALVRSRGSFFS